MVAPRTFLDYLVDLIDSNLTSWGSVEFWESLSEEEKQIVQSLKRLQKRIKYNQ